MKNSSPWFESLGGAPPISARVVAVAISTVRSASSKIGATGPVVCFLGSHFAVMARAMFSDCLSFRGWGWQLVFGFATGLENHLKAYAYYIYGLCIFPLMLSMSLRLFGLHEVGSVRGFGDANAAKPRHQFAHRMVACLLLVPFVQVLVGALAGFVALVLVLVLIAVHSLVGCRRYGGILYFWMRIAVRIGVRRAVGRWSR